MISVQLQRFFSIAIVFFLVFSGIVIVLSSWLAVFWHLNSLVIGVVSFLLSLWIIKKIKLNLNVPVSVLALSFLLLLFLFLSPLLHYGVAPSADAINSTTVRAISYNQRIPASYEPFSPVSFTYYPGFPLLTKLFSDFSFGWIMDYSWSWILGGIFAALQLIAIFLFANEFFGSQRAGLIASLLFFSTKLVFENFFWGEFAWLSATVFMLFSLLLLHKKNPLCLLFFPAVFILHPAIAINLIVFFAVLLWFHWIEKKQLFWSALSLLLAVPAFLVVYFPMLTNHLGSGFSFSLSQVHRLFLLFSVIPAWIGFGLSVAFVVVILLALLKKTGLFEKQSIPLIALFFVNFVFFTLFGFFGLVLANRIIELALFAILFFTAALIVRFDFVRRVSPLLLILFLLLAIFSFGVSSSLKQQFAGTKISDDDIILARQFFEIEPEPKKTIFISPNGGKIAEVSFKIPFDSNSGIFVPNLVSQVGNNPGFQKFGENHEYQKHIIQERCVQCILDLDQDFAWIDESIAPIKLPFEPILEYKTIKLYKLK